MREVGWFLISFPISQINLFHFIHGDVFGIRCELRKKISISGRPGYQRRGLEINANSINMAAVAAMNAPRAYAFA